MSVKTETEDEEEEAAEKEESDDVILRFGFGVELTQRGVVCPETKSQ